ncbi:hypothetical protein [Synechococcus sp. FACHB-909]|uniref:hypothetical protein n=1 Tax=Synechococcus sp. FACHB-909 TaxID=2692863 RepID=UPI0016895709|nr:hypothetical protein [Synechococcus sp. FACHB-909]MBD2720034.1 hypothetical protein [Synechococcus sp. FACHB-909]
MPLLLVPLLLGGHPADARHGKHCRASLGGSPSRDRRIRSPGPGHHRHRLLERS